jgi:hypothetical protein
MSKCQHRHSTPVRGFLEEGDPVAIHQCDTCGLALPALEPGEADVWKLPEFDAAVAERGYTRLLEQAFGYTNQKAENAINYVKGVRYEQRRNVR